MKCPNCNAETSDMLTRCEWCGAALHQAAAQPPADRPGPMDAPPQGGQPDRPGPMAPPPQGYPPAPAPYGPPPASVPPPSDASYPGYHQGGWAPAHEPVQPVHQPWYMKTSIYLIAVVVVVAVIGGLVAYKAVKGSGPTYANLLVGGQPTVLDFYTDT
jgi:hypothetical protein